MEGRCTLVAEGRLHGASRRARVWPVPHIWCTSSAVHLVEGARCGSGPCVALCATVECSDRSLSAAEMTVEIDFQSLEMSCGRRRCQH